jgi:hypothetical protein
MGIDGIGKRGGATGGTGVADAVGGGRIGTAPSVDKPFALNRTDGASAVAGDAKVGGAGEARGAAAAPGTSAHDRVRAGDMPVEQYLDHKVEEATRGLEGIGPHQLADIHAMLKDQLRSDPAFRELIERATGAVPAPPEE